MHEAGFVHRDLKPANVMWLPRENRWTVIDFGCAARIGAPAPLSFTLAYAAPEVLRAVERGIKTVESTPALDAWSLGVMAFELLTGSPAFKLVTDGRARVRFSIGFYSWSICCFMAHLQAYSCTQNVWCCSVELVVFLVDSGNKWMYGCRSWSSSGVTHCFRGRVSCLANKNGVWGLSRGRCCSCCSAILSGG
jgi:serine/threonine protein kinase